MAASGYMDMELINLEFWRWFPTKMNNAKNYRKREKKKKVFIEIMKFYLIIFFVVFFISI